jgi:hypothetical protein
MAHQLHPKKVTDDVLLYICIKDQEMKAELLTVFYVLEFHRNVQYFELGLRQHTLNEGFE